MDYNVEYPTSHLYFLVSVYTKKIQVTSVIFHGYTMRKGCITILYHAIENGGQMGRLCVMQLN